MHLRGGLQTHMSRLWLVDPNDWLKKLNWLGIRNVKTWLKSLRSHLQSGCRPNVGFALIIAEEGGSLEYGGRLTMEGGELQEACKQQNQSKQHTTPEKHKWGRHIPKSTLPPPSLVLALHCNSSVITCGTPSISSSTTMLMHHSNPLLPNHPKFPSLSHSFSLGDKIALEYEG